MPGVDTMVVVLLSNRDNADKPRDDHDRESSVCNLLNFRSAHDPGVWARFRRDSAGDSLGVVQDQRPPTRFHAQNLQFQLPTTTGNDTRGVRALLRRIARNPPLTRRFTRTTSSLVRKKSAKLTQRGATMTLSWRPACCRRSPATDARTVQRRLGRRVAEPPHTSASRRPRTRPAVGPRGSASHRVMEHPHMLGAGHVRALLCQPSAM